MGNFGSRSSGGRSGGGRDFGGGNRGGGRDFGGGRGGRSEMFRVVCDECGKGCEVPFKPTGDRPVYCSDCFGGGDSRGRDDRNDRGRGRDDRGGRGGRDDFGEKKMYSAVCDGCGNDCELPFRPTGDKPVFCSDCFEKEGKQKKGGADYKADFDALNAKLDMIIKFLGADKKKEPVAKIKLPKAEVVEENEEVQLEALAEEVPAEVKTAKKTTKKKA